MGQSPSFPKKHFSKEFTVIVTGANTGIGYEIAKWMSMLGATVILACRSKSRAEKAIQRMQNEYEDLKQSSTDVVVDIEKLSLEFLQLDCASFDSVINFVHGFISSGRPLHRLVCNAGIAGIERSFSQDGNEMHFQVNYLSHFLLTLKLLPVMSRSGSDCRVINITSFVYSGSSWIPGDIQGQKIPQHKWRKWEFYFRSKAFQIMQNYTLSKKITSKNVTFNSVNPGFVKTEISRYWKYEFWDIFGRLLFFIGAARKPFQGAETILDALINPEYEGKSARYLSDFQILHTKGIVNNKVYQEELWQYSLEKLHVYISPVDLAIVS